MSEEKRLLEIIGDDLFIEELGEDGFMRLPVEIEDELKLDESRKIAITPCGDGRYIIESQDNFLKDAPKRVATEQGMSHSDFDLMMAEHSMEAAFEHFSERAMLSDSAHFRRRKTD